MKSVRFSRTRLCVATLSGLLVIAGCSPAIDQSSDGVVAPGVNRFAQSEDHLIVAHRLVAADEHELALRSFTRAALDRGNTDTEILLGMGTANLGLGRLKQAERLLRLAAENKEAWPEVYNNLGVVLMEQGRNHEASQIFKKAYALDNGESDSIRDNLRLALSKSENSVILEDNQEDYKLVRRGRNDYLISKTP